MAIIGGPETLECVRGGVAKTSAVEGVSEDTNTASVDFSLYRV